MTDKSRPQSRFDGVKAQEFWEKEASRFDNHWPLIASLLRDRGHNAWLAHECDRLTAENKALIAAASENRACKATPSSYGGGAAQDQRWNCEDCGDVTDTARCPMGRQNETLAALASRSSERATWISEVIREIQEMPDRTSPDDFPDAMLVTAAELRRILEAVTPASAIRPTDVSSVYCTSPFAVTVVFNSTKAAMAFLDAVPMDSSEGAAK